MYNENNSNAIRFLCDVAIIFNWNIQYESSIVLPESLWKICVKGYDFQMDIQESGLKTVKNDYMESERLLRTPSTLAKEALFYVQEMGKMTCKKPHQNERDSLDSYLLIWVKNGCGSVTIDKEIYTAQKGDIIFLDCHQAYSHCSSASDPWELVWVHWNGKSLPLLYEVFQQRNPSVVVTGVSNLFVPLFERLDKIARDKSPDYEFYESECLIQLMTLLLTARSSEQMHFSQDASQKWEQIHEYLEEHFAEKVTLEELSQKFNISKYYMLRGFKRKYGVTIVQFINRCRMNYAKNLLRFTNKQVEEIAAECGVHDSSYFNRVFRTLEGISAGAYRKQWRN